MYNKTRLTRVFIAAMLYVPQLYAQPYTQDKSIKPHKITLEEMNDGSGGLWGGAKGTVASSQQYLLVNGLSVQRVIEVTLFPLTEGDSFKLEVSKNNWNEPLKSCESTNGDSCFVSFKTFDDAGFKISGSANGSWQLVIATSPELDVSDLIPTPLHSAKKTDANRLEAVAVSSEQITSSTESSSESPLLMIIIALLAVIIALLAFFIFKRNKGHAALLLLVLFGATPDAEALVALPPAGAINGMTEAAFQGEMDEVAAGTRRAEARNNVNKKLGETYNNYGKQLDALKSLKNLATSLENLSSCSNMANPPGIPRIPTFCEDNEECIECYKGARKDFNFVRTAFERLRIIYKCNKEFADDAIAFGDNVSGLHAMSGIAWQSSRQGIKDSIKTLQGSYDRKYLEFMSILQESMMKMNSCEAQWGVPDWYDRFGFIYVEFMADKYRRTD